MPDSEKKAKIARHRIIRIKGVHHGEFHRPQKRLITPGEANPGEELFWVGNIFGQDIRRGEKAGVCVNGYHQVIPEEVLVTDAQAYRNLGD